MCVRQRLEGTIAAGLLMRIRDSASSNDLENGGAARLSKEHRWRRDAIGGCV